MNLINQAWRCESFPAQLGAGAGIVYGAKAAWMRLRLFQKTENYCADSIKLVGKLYGRRRFKSFIVRHMHDWLSGRAPIFKLNPAIKRRGLEKITVPAWRGGPATTVSPFFLF